MPVTAWQTSGVICTNKKQKGRAELDADWEFVVKMALIARDRVKGIQHHMHETWA